MKNMIKRTALALASLFSLNCVAMTENVSLGDIEANVGLNVCVGTTNNCPFTQTQTQSKKNAIAGLPPAAFKLDAESVIAKLRTNDLGTISTDKVEKVTLPIMQDGWKLFRFTDAQGKNIYVVFVKKVSETVVYASTDGKNWTYKGFVPNVRSINFAFTKNGKMKLVDAQGQAVMNAEGKPAVFNLTSAEAQAAA